MKSLFFILLYLSVSWFAMDISSESKAESVLMPLLFFVSLIGLLLKVVFFMHNRGIGSPDGASNNDSLGFDVSDD